VPFSQADSTVIYQWTSTWSVVDKFTNQGNCRCDVDFYTYRWLRVFSLDVSDGSAENVTFSSDRIPYRYKVTAPGHVYVEGIVDATQSNYVIQLTPAYVLSGVVYDASNKYLTDYEPRGH
jgi:hypothetical protein